MYYQRFGDPEMHEDIWAGRTLNWWTLENGASDRPYRFVQISIGYMLSLWNCVLFWPFYDRVPNILFLGEITCYFWRKCGFILPRTDFSLERIWKYCWTFSWTQKGIFELCDFSNSLWESQSYISIYLFLDIKY